MAAKAILEHSKSAGSHAATDTAEALRQATARADAAEAELARLKSAQTRSSSQAVPSPPSADPGLTMDPKSEDPDGVEALRKDSMMAHLLDSLEAGKDIGHYGRLVFAIVAHRFLSHDETLRYLTMDKDFSEEQALLMLHQVEDRQYSPPRRERILEWQSEQDFPILPNPEDPDCGNLYRNLKFPTETYDHIGQYQEEKLHAAE
jgi:hypothetical protein